MVASKNVPQRATCLVVVRPIGQCHTHIRGGTAGPGILEDYIWVLMWVVSPLEAFVVVCQHIVLDTLTQSERAVAIKDTSPTKTTYIFRRASLPQNEHLKAENI